MYIEIPLDYPFLFGSDPSKSEVTFSFTADMLHNLGMDASVSDVLGSFEVTFANVSSPEQLVEDFYVAKQAQDERLLNGDADWKF